MLRTLCTTDNDLGSLVLRVILGGVFFPHGAQKALAWFGGHGMAPTVAFFDQAFGVPAALAYLVIAAEFLGAIALVLGLLTRFAAFGIFAVMAGAIYLVHWQNGFFMNWTGSQQGEGIEYHLLVLGMALALMIRGGGRASFDRVLSR
ncbi:DoxX family protein [Syntrophotalea carbinolica DSM 2380]|uniref:DoxX family protein n=1 Tax=Syntrophotalea carbinolica (strain DSM 2380 / NBRC 103641 / GraBd1) TaxID=338963 RepID=Q3A8K7_SYNC1|nr:DoxX family protein [Syntrophotalea carbinolica]ABA87285.1 DoxX family protein [Syntrophotalea carbinolica DSM 2380]